VLDAGTGLRAFGHALGSSPFRGTILLGHLHWDHVQGLPFFAGARHPSSRTSVLLPEQGDAVDVLARAISPPHFPIRPSELRGTWQFGCLGAGWHEIEGWSVLALDIPHRGGRTFGFRVSDGTSTLAYLSDHSPTTVGPGPDGLGARHPAALALAEGVDVLLHDAQHLVAEFPDRPFLGHATVEYTIALGVEALAAGVVLFHHDPHRTDDEIDAIVARCRDAPVPVVAAAEGRAIEPARRL
jgi:phosphoribosyl 1,2-cyclic phosphodiesterase